MKRKLIITLPDASPPDAADFSDPDPTDCVADGDVALSGLCALE